MELDQYRGQAGVWVIFSYCDGPSAGSIHVKPRDAIEQLSNGEQIAFWPMGLEFRDAINRWEKRHQEAELMNEH